MNGEILPSREVIQILAFRIIIWLYNAGMSIIAHLHCLSLSLRFTVFKNIHGNIFGILQHLTFLCLRVFMSLIGVSSLQNSISFFYSFTHLF